MSSLLFMVEIVFLVETVSNAEAEVVAPAEMGHQGDMGVDVVVHLISGSDFLEDVAFAEIGKLIVFQVPSKFEVI